MADTISSGVIAGIDLGGTKILSAVASADGVILATDIRPTDADRGPDAVFARMIASLTSAVQSARLSPRNVSALGVGVPGPINQATGIVSDPPNLPGWHDVPVRKRLSDAFGIPVFVENDANAAALGEHRFGAGRGTRHMIYLTVSTGIGGGIIIDGQLYRGTSGAAGELGHIVISADGPLCSCGASGHLEALASGTALAREGALLLAQGRAPILARLAGAAPMTAELVAKAASADDPHAQRLIRDAARYLGLGLASFVNIFNPQAIVIGGGAAKIGAPLIGHAEEIMRATAFPQPVSDVVVLPSELGDEAVVRGAIALASHESQRAMFH